MEEHIQIFEFSFVLSYSFSLLVFYFFIFFSFAFCVLLIWVSFSGGNECGSCWEREVEGEHLAQCVHHYAEEDQGIGGGA